MLDPNAGLRTIYVAQGEIAVDEHPDTVIVTLLGSCVSVCLFDPLARVGGMNHILLPQDGCGVRSRGQAVHTMESLINPILKLGGSKGRLQAKVFGGASFSGALGDIGSRNIAFVTDFLSNENIRCIGKSLGGDQARRVKFWPASGRAQQKLVKDVPQEAPQAVAASTEVEMF